MCLLPFQRISGGDGPCYVVALLRENAIKKLKDLIESTNPDDDRFWQNAFGIERVANHVHCMTLFFAWFSLYLEYISSQADFLKIFKETLGDSGVILEVLGYYKPEITIFKTTMASSLNDCYFDVSQYFSL